MRSLGVLVALAALALVACGGSRSEQLPGDQPPEQPTSGTEGAFDWEVGYHYTGGEFANIEIEGDDPRVCYEACVDEPQCVAFTYVNPGYQSRNGQCWLKRYVTGRVESACCISGVIR